MSKPKPPPPPDPYAVSQAQTQQNEATARLNAQLNRVNQYTPYGSVTYTNQGDTWSQHVNESDAQKQLRELQEKQGQLFGQLGIDQTNRVSDILSKPYESRRFNMRDAVGGRLKLNQALGGRFDASKWDPSQLGNFQNNVRDRSFMLATAGMDRAFGRQEEDLRTRLANQGIMPGTEAFDAEMAAFNTGRGDSYSRALLDADQNALAWRGQAVDELGQGFGQALAGRGQNLSELLTQRGTNLSEALQQYNLDTTADLADRQNPLNEIIALMSGVQTSPINPGSPYATNVATTDVAGIHQGAWNAQNQNYQTQMGGFNGLWGGLAGLGGAALGGARPWWM